MLGSAQRVGRVPCVRWLCAGPSTALSKQEVLSMYKQLLRMAKVFPSIKRDQLYSDIQQEFRENAEETDASRIAVMHETAVRGVSQMAKYIGFDPTQDVWAVELEQDPLGGPPPEDTKA